MDKSIEDESITPVVTSKNTTDVTTIALTVPTNMPSNVSTKSVKDQKEKTATITNGPDIRIENLSASSSEVIARLDKSDENMDIHKVGVINDDKENVTKLKILQDVCESILTQPGISSTKTNISDKTTNIGVNKNIKKDTPEISKCTTKKRKQKLSNSDTLHTDREITNEDVDLITNRRKLDATSGIYVLIEEMEVNNTELTLKSPPRKKKKMKSRQNTDSSNDTIKSKNFDSKKISTSTATKPSPSTATKHTPNTNDTPIELHKNVGGAVLISETIDADGKKTTKKRSLKKTSTDSTENISDKNESSKGSCKNKTKKKSKLDSASSTGEACVKQESDESSNTELSKSKTNSSVTKTAIPDNNKKTRKRMKRVKLDDVLLSPSGSKHMKLSLNPAEIQTDKKASNVNINMESSDMKTLRNFDEMQAQSFSPSSVIPCTSSLHDSINATHTQPILSLSKHNVPLNKDDIPSSSKSGIPSKKRQKKPRKSSSQHVLPIIPSNQTIEACIDTVQVNAVKEVSISTPSPVNYIHGKLSDGKELDKQVSSKALHKEKDAAELNSLASDVNEPSKEFKEEEEDIVSFYYHILCCLIFMANTFYVQVIQIFCF